MSDSISDRWIVWLISVWNVWIKTNFQHQFLNFLQLYVYTNFYFTFPITPPRRHQNKKPWEACPHRLALLDRLKNSDNHILMDRRHMARPGKHMKELSQCERKCDWWRKIGMRMETCFLSEFQMRLRGWNGSMLEDKYLENFWEMQITPLEYYCIVRELGALLESCTVNKSYYTYIWVAILVFAVCMHSFKKFCYKHSLNSEMCYLSKNMSIRVTRGVWILTLNWCKKANKHYYF